MPARIDLWDRVDKRGADECWPWTGATFHDGYGKYRKLYRAHRAMFESINGPIPDGLLIDHICRNRICVNPNHLRPVTRKQNNENRGPQANSKTGVRGVLWDATARKYRVAVVHNYVRHEGGRFTSLEDAEAAAIALRNELFTHNDSDREP